MKLAWKLAVVCFLLLATCTLLVLVRSFREPRIDNLSADVGASNDRLTSPTFGTNASHRLGPRLKRANSTSTSMKISQTSPSPIQNYQVERRKQSVMENVVSIKKKTNTTEAQTSFTSNQKQSKQMHEMEPKSSVRPANPLHSVITTTGAHQSQEQKSGHATNQPEIGKTTGQPSPKPSLTSDEEPLVELALEKDRARHHSEVAKSKIMLTIRTTMSFHKKRLPVLFDTWLTKVNVSDVFLVTDGDDKEYVTRTKQIGKNILD